jgi:hypothetical protein
MGYSRFIWTCRRKIRYLPLEKSADRLSLLIESSDELTAATYQSLIGVPYRKLQDAMIVVHRLIHDSFVHRVDLRQGPSVFKICDRRIQKHAYRAPGLVPDPQEMEFPLQISR